MTRDCPRILHTRVTCFLADPTDPEAVWAGVEIDGLHRSGDGGRTWEPVGSGLSSRDVHSLTAVPGANGPALLAATKNDLNRSDDGGRTWQPQGIGRSLPWSYCRALAQPVGTPGQVLLGTGDGPPGSEGAVARSVDAGAHWGGGPPAGADEQHGLGLCTHAQDPQRIYSASVSGQVYRSADGGASWQKLAREFGEIRALAWTP